MEKKVQVKILKFVGTYAAGQVVEVSEQEAKDLCHVNVISDGITEKKSVRAMLLSDYEKIEEKSKSLEGLTAGEMAALGKKNIASPPQTAEEKKAAKEAEKAAKEKEKADAKAAKEAEKQAKKEADEAAKAQAEKLASSASEVQTQQ